MRGAGMAWAAVVALMLPLQVVHAATATTALRPWKSGATPALVLRDAANRELSLSALRGKVVLVSFWATYCEPCREEMPAMQTLKQRLGLNFEVLMVNVGESEQKVERFFSETKLQPGVLTVLYDRDSSVAKRWNARMLPASYIVRADGRIAWSALGEVDWTAADVVKAVEDALPRDLKPTVKQAK